MAQDNKNRRLILIITNTFPEDLNYKWFSELPFINSLINAGLWAQLNFSDTEEIEKKLQYLASGTALIENRITPFWEFLEDSGKMVSFYGPSPSKTVQFPDRGKDADLLQKGDEWQLLIINSLTEQSDSVKNVPPTDMDYWRKWDREIEDLIQSTENQPSIIILAMSSTPHLKSWVLAGGPTFASPGNPGPIDIFNLPPTILWLLDVDPPPEMVGHIMDEILDTEDDLTQEEMDLLTDHLRGLGYLG